MPNNAHAKRGLRRQNHARKQRAAQRPERQKTRLDHAVAGRSTERRARGHSRLRSPAELRSIDNMTQDLMDIAAGDIDAQVA